MLRKISFVKVCFVLVIIVACTLRFAGTYPGFHRFHSDEANIYTTVVLMIKNGNIRLQRYEYPSMPHLVNLVIYKTLFIPLGWLNFFAHNLGKIVDGFIKFPLGKDEYNRIFQLEILGSQDRNVLFWGRYVTAFFGVCVVIVSYFISAKMFGKWSGILSSLLIAVNYRQVLNSHFGLPDIYNAFFLLLSSLMAWKLYEKRRISYYILGGIAAGLCLATKYQIFGFLPFIVVHIYIAFEKRKTTHFLKSLFDLKIFLIPILAILVFLITNPYQLIDLEKMIDDISYAGKLYGVGSWELTLYPYWYLVNFGLGVWTILLFVISTAVLLKKNFKKAFFWLFPIISFFFFFTFYTKGGFYTRNFVSIIPSILVLAGGFFSYLLKVKSRIIKVFCFVIIFLAIFENFTRSATVVREYLKPWNRDVVEKWIIQNIPVGTTVAAHSSVPVPDNLVRVDYDLVNNFSMDELRQKHAKYAIVSFDWATIDYYWWMQSNYKEFLRFDGKPTKLMKNMFAALSVYEVADFGLYSVFNDALAPDQDFIVSKVPYYVVSKEEEKYQIDSLNLGDRSKLFDVHEWQGFEVTYKARLDSAKKDYRDGYLVLRFYESKEKYNQGEYSWVRVSSRFTESDKLINSNLIGKVPAGAKYMDMGFEVYSLPTGTPYIEDVLLKKVEVKEDLEGFKVNKVKIEDDNLFPHSHGNL